MATISESRSRRFAWPATIAFLIVIVIWLVLPRFFPDDKYAATNALFSGLAFAGLLIAVLLQREELQLQRKELKDTREVLESQKEQLEGQKRQMEIQNFENRFFQMLAMWNELRRHLEPRYQYQDKVGFEGLMRRLRNQISDQDWYDHDPMDLSFIDEQVRHFYASCPESVRNYMGVLYNLLKLVDRADIIGARNQKFYTNIVRIQLSQHELVVVFYNCLSQYGRDKFKPLAEKYSLFKHVNDEYLMMPEHRGLYKEGAFK
jgi:hypothetical protein